MRHLRPVAILALSAFLVGWNTLYARDYSYPIQDSSLGGMVKSDKGELLEGILIRAKAEGGKVAVTVVSDAQGRYRFPHLDAGRYLVETARADGFESVKYHNVEIKPTQAAQQDFNLSPAKTWDESVSAVDWLLNLPGTERERNMMNLCVGCHFNTVRKFRFDKESWLKIVRVMRGKYGNLLYQNWGLPQHEQTQNAPPSIEQPDWEPTNQAYAEYLAKVRGPVPHDWTGAKVLPRQKGPATKVIYTEYDLDYDSPEPHEIAVAKDGMVFWGDWRWGVIGQFDPRTGEMKRWEAGQAEGKPPVHPGVFEIAFDKDENPWTSIVWQGALVKLDRKAGQLTNKWIFPDRGNRRIIMVHSDPVRNRIWFDTDDYYGDFDMAYYEPDTGKLVKYDMPRPAKIHSSIYGNTVDSKGNAYAFKIADSQIDRIDVNTEKITTYNTPTPKAGPRRGDYDNEDNIWFSENSAMKVGKLDAKTFKITEYPLPVPIGNAYTSNVDRRTGLVWTSEHFADRIAGLNPKTGEMRDYLLPSLDSQIRIIDSYSVGDHTVLWFGVMGKYNGGKIGKMEVWW